MKVAKLGGGVRMEKTLILQRGAVILLKRGHGKWGRGFEGGEGGEMNPSSPCKNVRSLQTVSERWSKSIAGYLRESGVLEEKEIKKRVKCRKWRMMQGGGGGLNEHKKGGIVEASDDGKNISHAARQLVGSLGENSNGASRKIGRQRKEEDKQLKDVMYLRSYR